MPAQTTALQCQRLTEPSAVPLTKRQTCLEALADGWVGAPDLCPVCTKAFMTALDGIAGPMTWHPNYRARAER